MAKIPFTLEAWLKDKSQKVETRYGRPVRIICWDRAVKENQPKDLKLCVLVQEDNGEAVYYYRTDGTKWVQDVNYDLFIVTPEPELSEFEKACGLEIFDEPFEEKHIKVIKEESAKLLSIARRELCEQIVDHTKEAYENGKAEALKDLPRWKKDESFEMEGTFMGVKGRECFVVKDGYSISVAELIKKLPGFKEDEK